nr:MAG TPA: hypothetical protein [Caudoviricetes sp.]
MNFLDWYTDMVDVYRVVPTKDGDLTRQERQRVLQAIPCRVYQSDSRAINMTQTSADVRQEDKLSCDISAEIQAGDELIITRGARLGRTGPVIRAFAGVPNLYYEPFGAVIPGLSHQEIRLLQQERVKGGGPGDAGTENGTVKGNAAED